MAAKSLSDSFNMIFISWKIFGIWPGRSKSKYYKYFSFFYVFLFLIAYNAILTVNLFYTPLEVKFIIEEVIFYFNEVAIMTKVATILYWRKEILTVFGILDCELFKGNDEVGREIIAKNIRRYKTFWKLYALLCNLTFVMSCIIPVLSNLMVSDYNLKLPVSHYHLLSHKTKDQYFVGLYLYQIIGIYGQMTYNVSIDSFIAGLLLHAITQLKVLSLELKNLKWNKRIAQNKQAKMQLRDLQYCLRHYECILHYCYGVQRVLSFALFVQFGMASALICVILCAVLLPNLQVVSMLSYLTCMMIQIFVPAWLGTQLTYESQKLVFAAYSSEWMSMSEPFKCSVKLFMERAKTPIVITGMKLFKLNVENFTAIMKTAYSFLTLVRNVQEDT